MTRKRKNFRLITLSLQIITIIAYFIPPLVMGGGVDIFWLALGVIHTSMFCAVFFRDSRKRTALSVIFMILIILWCVLVTGFGLLFAQLRVSMGGDAFTSLFIYSLCSLLAIIFALAAPRKIHGKLQETIQVDPIENAE